MRYHVQLLKGAMEGPIPEHLWETRLETDNPEMAIEEYDNLDLIIHPEPGWWAGHVRILDTVRGVLVMPVDLAKGQRVLEPVRAMDF